MKTLKIISLTFILFGLLSSTGYSQNTNPYDGIYKGEIVKANYKKLPSPKTAQVIVTSSGITLMSEYSVYERYAGTHDKTMTGKLNEGEFFIQLDKSAHDEDGTMMVIVKEIELTNIETMQPEKIKSITITISEFGKNETLTFRGKKLD